MSETTCSWGPATAGITFSWDRGRGRADSSGVHRLWTDAMGSEADDITMSESESRADPVSQSSNDEGLEGEDAESDRVAVEERSS